MFSGRISDAWGRAYSTAIGTLAQIISMVLLIFNPFEYAFFVSAFFYGIGQGFNAPSLFAWASDTATAENRGKALASLFMMLEFGIIFGGYFAGKMTMQWSMKSTDVFIMNASFFIVAFVFSVYSIFKTVKTAKNK
jgi:MFS family permease